jgi:hypothetical protein
MPPLPVTALEMQPTRVETSVEAVAQTEGARKSKSAPASAAS